MPAVFDRRGSTAFLSVVVFNDPRRWRSARISGDQRQVEVAHGIAALPALDHARAPAAEPRWRSPARRCVWVGPGTPGTGAGSSLDCAVDHLVALAVDGLRYPGSTRAHGPRLGAARRRVAFNLAQRAPPVWRSGPIRNPEFLMAAARDPVQRARGSALARLYSRSIWSRWLPAMQHALAAGVGHATSRHGLASEAPLRRRRGSAIMAWRHGSGGGGCSAQQFGLTVAVVAAIDPWTGAPAVVDACLSGSTAGPVGEACVSVTAATIVPPLLRRSLFGLGSFFGGQRPRRPCGFALRWPRS